MRIYQAGPLFTEAECDWHRKLKARLTALGHEVIWPGELITEQDIAAWGADAPSRIFEADRDALVGAELVIALLDGVQVDDGTAWEIGFAYARGIPVIGIRTDARHAGETSHSTVNAMIEGSCKAIFRNCDELEIALKNW